MIPDKRIKLQEKMKGTQSNKYASKYKRMMMLTFKKLLTIPCKLTCVGGKHMMTIVKKTKAEEKEEMELNGCNIIVQSGKW